MLELPFVFCNSAHCFMEAVLFILDVYELRSITNTNRFVFCMYASAFPLLFVFQLCSFLVQMCLSLIVKVNVGFLKA